MELIKKTQIGENWVIARTLPEICGKKVFNEQVNQLWRNYRKTLLNYKSSESLAVDIFIYFGMKHNNYKFNNVIVFQKQNSKVCSLHQLFQYFAKFCSNFTFSEY